MSNQLRVTSKNTTLENKTKTVASITQYFFCSKASPWDLQDNSIALFAKTIVASRVSRPREQLYDEMIQTIVKSLRNL